MPAVPLSFRRAAASAALAAAAVPLAVAPAVAQSTVTTYTSSAAFLAALRGLSATTETYESYPLNSTISSGATLNGITYTAFPAGVWGRIADNYNGLGTRSLAAFRPGNTAVDYFQAGETVVVSFAQPVTAFGLFFNANVSPGGSLFVRTPFGFAFNGDGYDQGTFYFVGLVSNTAFTTASFGSSATGSTYNVDNLTYAASAVPEPATVVLAGAGLVATFGLARRRARA